MRASKSLQRVGALVFTLIVIHGGGHCWAQEISLERRQISWMLWWETHRDVYLGERFAAEGDLLRQVPFAEKREAHRGAVIEALIEASRSGDPYLKAEAALALGRLRADEAVPRLAELTQDGAQQVRRAAVVALGLVDTPASRELLADPGNVDEMDVLAWIAALMMLEEPSENLVRGLGRLARDQRSEHVQWMAAWALRTMKPEGYLEVLYPMLHDTPSVLLASEIVLAMGQNADPEDLELLMLIAEARLDGGRLNVMRQAAGARNGPNINVALHNMEPTLRVAAAIALEQYTDHDPDDRRLRQPRRGMRRNLERLSTSLTGGNYWGPSLMALGEIGDEDDRDFVASFIGADTVHQNVTARGSTWEMSSARRHSIRGFAAISLGRQLGAASGHGWEPESREARDHERRVRRATRTLGQHLQRDGEPAEFRAACALALGFSGDAQAVPWLIETVPKLGQGDELVFGHCVLALAMLGEPAALEAAVAFFGAGGEPDIERLLERGVADEMPLAPVMGARAAALGVALMGDERAVPVLAKHWGGNPWVSQELARSIGWLGGYEFSEMLIPLLKQNEHPGLSRLAARSLGEMFDADRPSRLSRLVRNTNYTHQVSTERLGEVQPHLRERRIDRNIPALANPLIYHHVLPTSSDWAGF